ncbi:acyl carrier protein [Methylovulum psychrotolerans]|uniref:Aminoacyl carrier protein 2 n=1 Tax=Methylovulum psychrotolerans TaxID=1704499 RepID=A0A2S5CGW8_9GAMM|nr:phosphopantetheine-binding protein [Methylovulum psychrotolerans]POZ50051.1 Aminoacyl carrier protein 2 [Methylovulum psychrotolerans]
MTTNPTQDDIESQLCEFLRTNVLAGDVAVSPETPLSLIGVDSFALMELVLFIERRFGLELPAEALTPENIASAGALAGCCVVLLAQNRHA